MSIEKQTRAENILDHAVEAGAAGLRLNFSTQDMRRRTQRQLFAARLQRRKEMKRVYEPLSEEWGTSPWDHLLIVSEGATKLWIVPEDAYFDSVLVSPEPKVSEKDNA